MALFIDTYCELCESFINKEEWNNYLYSNRHLHTEVNGHWPPCFPQRPTTRDEGSIFEKVFWEMIFRIVAVLPVYGFIL